MLGALRKQSRNVIIYIFFGIIIAVFIINFGPQSQGCAPTVSSAARVAGRSLTEQDFRHAYIIFGGSEMPLQVAKQRRLKEFIMDKLIERELLANEAERLGFRVSDREAEELIASGRIVVLGVRQRLDRLEWVFPGGQFDYDLFKKNFVQNRLGMTVRQFVEEQRRELLADKVREVMRAAVKVSPEEVKADFVEKSLQVDLEYVRFEPQSFEGEVKITTADVDAYLAKHADAVAKEYQGNAFRYKGLPKQARLRQILIMVDKDAEAAEVEAASKKIAAARRAIQEGEDFAGVARRLSQDERSRGRGGDLGWVRKGGSGQGTAVDEAAFKLVAGALGEPVRSDRGFHLLRVDGFREGDQALDKVKREIAEDKLRAERTQELARKAAEAALGRIKTGGNLEQLFPRVDVGNGQEASSSSPAASPDRPKLEETGLFSRRGGIVPGVGLSEELTRDAFALTKDKPQPAKIYSVQDSLFLVRLKERKDADLAEYEQKKDELRRQQEQAKWAEVLDAWSKQRCVEAREAGKIDVNPALVAYEGLSAKGEPGYTPCGSSLPAISGE